MALNKKETAGIIIRAAVAMTLFIIAVTNYDYLSSLDPEAILSSFDNTQIIVAVVLGMYIVKALVFVLPASVIYVAVGVILDTWLAVGVNIFGIVLEVMITYCLGRFLGGDYVSRILSKNTSFRSTQSARLQEATIRTEKCRMQTAATCRIWKAMPMDALRWSRFRICLMTEKKG